MFWVRYDAHHQVHLVEVRFDVAKDWQRGRDAAKAHCYGSRLGTLFAKPLSPNIGG
jgi:hypothetical protein